MAAKDNNQQNTVKYNNVSTVSRIKPFDNQEFELQSLKDKKLNKTWTID